MIISGSNKSYVNDVHSRLNRTRVDGIIEVRSITDIQAAIRMADARQKSVAICGGRHAMGGQQFGTDAVLLDMTRMKRVLAFDRRNGLIEVEAGMQWPGLIDYLEQAAGDGSPAWSIRQKQTGADTLSLGGCLAANVHGRGLRMRPFIDDVEAFTLIDANGVLHTCSRLRNRPLFRLAIGGYGLFGVITSVTLRLMPRRKMQRDVRLLNLGQLLPAFDECIAAGYCFGDFQFAIDPAGNDFLERGVFSCYRPLDQDAPLTQAGKILSEDDWRRLLALAHCDKTRAFQCYAEHYLATSGQIYWSDRLQQATYLDGYHDELDARIGHKGSEIIGELYVPRERLVDFMREAAADFRLHGIDLIYGTIRLIERDEESFLPWAKQAYACVIFNLHTRHEAHAIEKTQAAFRRLIDMASRRGGSYYLTYHKFATRSQVETCYPRFAEFLRCKRIADPRERFQSDWYRHHRDMFALTRETQP